MRDELAMARAEVARIERAIEEEVEFFRGTWERWRSSPDPRGPPPYGKGYSMYADLHRAQNRLYRAEEADRG